MITQLDIINAMLAVNGEAEVTSVASTNPAAIHAKRSLARVDKALQARGWWFNTETFTLSPNASGEVVLPSNVLSVDPKSVISPYVQRGTRLYDKVNNTFVIGKTVRSRLILQLDIDELPVTAADYIQAVAVRRYYRDDDGDATKVADLRRDEEVAYAFLQREHLAALDVNIKTSPTGIQMAEVYNIGRSRYDSRKEV
jgi:hypothetical protein